MRLWLSLCSPYLAPPLHLTSSTSSPTYLSGEVGMIASHPATGLFVVEIICVSLKMITGVMMALHNIYAHKHKHTHMHIHTYTQKHTHIYTNTHTYTPVHTRTHTKNKQTNKPTTFIFCNSLGCIWARMICDNLRKDGHGR